jgi:hypothetical protein
MHAQLVYTSFCTNAASTQHVYVRKEIWMMGEAMNPEAVGACIAFYFSFSTNAANIQHMQRSDNMLFHRAHARSPP